MKKSTKTAKIQIPLHLNPTVRLVRLDKKLCKRRLDLKKHEYNNNTVTDNKSNELIENMLNARVVLERVNLLQCQDCLAYFKNITDLKLHSANHIAPIVKTEFSHEKYNNLVKRYTCEECGWKFVAESTLIAHSILHEPFPNICHCGIGFYKKKDLKAHQGLVHEQYPWKPKSSYAGHKVKPEFSVAHSEGSEINVTETNGNIDIVTNIGTIVFRNGVKKFSCKECNKELSTRSGLENHRLIHTGEKPFKCEDCGKSYRDRSTYQRHTNYYCKESN